MKQEFHKPIINFPFENKEDAFLKCFYCLSNACYKKSSAAKHAKNRNECKPNKSESKLSMKPLISMQQGTVKF